MHHGIVAIPPLLCDSKFTFLQNYTLITIKLFSMPGYVYLDILEWFVRQSLHKNGDGGGGGYVKYTYPLSAKW